MKERDFFSGARVESRRVLLVSGWTKHAGDVPHRQKVSSYPGSAGFDRRCCRQINTQQVLGVRIEH